MKNKKIVVIGLLLLSLLLVACGATKEANFPTGKFLKSGTVNHGLVFNEDGTFSVFDGNITIVNGTYSVDGDTYTDESNNQSCPPMSFKYTFDGTNLTFNYVGNPADDPCDGRRADFNDVTYIISK
jgi:major membrane immunogen (membrane-anchored lipoprotein)